VGEERIVSGTHMRFCNAGGVLDLAKDHLHLVHAPALPQFILQVTLVVLDRILRLQEQVLALCLLERVKARVSSQIRAWGGGREGTGLRLGSGSMAFALEAN
jgi:hypothetical protein